MLHFLDSSVRILAPGTTFIPDREITLIPRFLKLRILPQFLEPGFLLLPIDGATFWEVKKAVGKVQSV